MPPAPSKKEKLRMAKGKAYRAEIKSDPKTKTINLGLQGGGAHGAFTWGVLDKLLEDGRIAIDGFCGTSAGAMNAVVYAYSKMLYDTDYARQALHDFWHDVSKAGQIFSPARMNPLGRFFGGKLHDQASFAAFDSFTRSFSPYQFNPLNLNPLRDILQKHVDFERLQACYCTNVFVCATNARTGKPRIFNNTELSVDAVMASTCLPSLFQAVEIDGEEYWDGGFIGNPALYPLVYGTNTNDFLVVHVNPLERKKLPRDAMGIMNRVNEVTFNAALVKEMRAIAFVRKIIDEGWLKDEFKHKLKPINMHAIRTDEVIRSLDVASKFNTDWDFLRELRDLGRARAELWLNENFQYIGKKSTVDIRRDYL